MAFLLSIPAQDLTFVDTVPHQPLGMRGIADTGVYQYVQASTAVAQYDLVKISNTYTVASGTTTLLPSTEPAKCGIAQVAIVASSYGWVFVGPGQATCNVLASCVQDVKLYTTGTAGNVDDSATTLINGLKLITTIVGAAASPIIAECELGTVLA